MDTERLFRTAADNARAHFGGSSRRSSQPTHFVNFDAVDLGHGRRRALCGQVVHEPTQHAVDPSCEACRRAQTEIDGMRF